MFFQEIKENLARKLQNIAPYFCAFTFFVFSQGSLLASDWEEPIVLLNDPLVPAIELREGVISEVQVGSDREFVFSKSESMDGIFLQSQNIETNKIFSHTIENSPYLSFAMVPLSDGKGRVVIQYVGFGFVSGVCFEPENLGVKSIANSGLLGFLGICLSRSELPSKNFSMPCENFPLKSMTQKSANDWKSSWQRVRTTSLWHLSTNSSKSQKTSIRRLSMNPTHNTSDISFTWSNGMDGSQQTYSQTKRVPMEVVQVFEVVKNSPRQLTQQILRRPKNLDLFLPNRQLL